MQKILYLHIGSGKTGTSALQSMLALNRNKLSKECNIYYPPAHNDVRAINMRTTSGNGLEFGHQLVRQDQPLDGIENYWRSFKEASNGKNILLSSEYMEGFIPQRLELLKELVSKDGYEIRVIYYVRAIADHIVSAYHQSVKRHLSSDSLSNFVKNRIKGNNHYIFYRTITKILRVVGKRGVILRNYDKTKSNIFDDFLYEVLGIDRSINDFVLPDTKINRSLSSFELDLMRRMNSYFEHMRESVFVSNALIHNLSDIDYNMTIDKDTLALLKDRYAQDLEWINMHLPQDQRELKMIDSLEVTDSESNHNFNKFQESMIAIVAELIKRNR